MNPLSPAIIARWSPMWAKDCCSERPWWRIGIVPGNPVQTSFPARYVMEYRRVDGKTVHLGYQSANAEWRDLTAHLTEMARIDAAHPLPAPPPLPGQVWATPRPGYGDGWGYHLVTVAAPFVGDSWLVHLGGDGSVAQTYRMGEATPDASAWPPPGAILVAGPTPWGRDIPWGPA